jgi:hypothetical protein
MVNRGGGWHYCQLLRSWCTFRNSTREQHKHMDAIPMPLVRDVVTSNRPSKLDLAEMI